MLTYNFTAGFKVADVGCCGAGGTYKGLIPCLPNMQICPNRFEYLFWDPYHPTEKANVYLSQNFFDGVGYSYPMNIKQLLLS
jgi:phospholipase/lecithinase/hemolysin